MQAIDVQDGIYWVGVYNPGLEVFDELYPTQSGTTYNAYIVKGNDKTVLIDTVEDHFYPDFMQRLSGVCDVEDIDIIVSNHTEHDHSGSIGKLLEMNPDIEVYCSKSAELFLRQQMNCKINSHPVKDGEELDLGGKTLKFIVAPFLHWPDTMLTYLVEEQLLFSCDAFGAHHCPPIGQIFSDEIEDVPALDFDCKFYFDTIIRPFKANVRNALQKVADTPIQIICPSHGPIRRHDLPKLMESYQQWSAPCTIADDVAKRVLLLEHSPHGTVRSMGDRVEELLEQYDCSVIRMAAIDLDEERFMQELECCDALIIGAATINRDAGAPVWQALRLLSAVEPKNKLAAVYGAYGWSGEAVKLIEDRLLGLRYKLASQGVRWQFTPTADDIDKCLSLIQDLIAALTKSSKK